MIVIRSSAKYFGSFGLPSYPPIDIADAEMLPIEVPAIISNKSVICIVSGFFGCFGIS